MIDKEQLAEGTLNPPPPIKRKRAPAKKKPEPPKGRKTLIAAMCAAALALVDLYMTVRLGIPRWW